VRRLLDAYGRDPLFARWATAQSLRAWMQGYFGEAVLMSRVHHNCVMTKHPRYGSLTNWHRDIRYWSFEREDLVSVWLALGEERIDNGALWFVPASHRMALDADRFDEAKVSAAGAGGCGVLSLQYAALGRQERQRCGQALAGLHLPRPQQRAAAEYSVLLES
jgi:hypothetical protein